MNGKPARPLGRPPMLGEALSGAARQAKYRLTEKQRTHDRAALIVMLVNRLPAEEIKRLTGDPRWGPLIAEARKLVLKHP